jgi:hypothetical protein
MKKFRQFTVVEQVEQKELQEDMPANSVGTGAETSLPPSVEPGVKKKKVPSFISYVPRRTPQ